MSRASAIRSPLSMRALNRTDKHVHSARDQAAPARTGPATLDQQGGVAERPNAVALKATDPQGSGGSNPSASALVCGLAGLLALDVADVGPPEREHRERPVGARHDGEVPRLVHLDHSCAEP